MSGIIPVNPQLESTVAQSSFYNFSTEQGKRWNMPFAASITGHVDLALPHPFPQAKLNKTPARAVSLAAAFSSYVAYVWMHYEKTFCFLSMSM
jgi:hypothetical protein